MPASAFCCFCLSFSAFNILPARSFCCLSADTLACSGVSGLIFYISFIRIIVFIKLINVQFTIQITTLMIRLISSRAFSSTFLTEKSNTLYSLI
jgi:hypothetical protein